MVIHTDTLEKQEQAQFVYPKADIMKVVEARTSYFGKMRGDKDNHDYITRMSLTEGESFLSDDMLNDAIVHVYEWVQAFAREIDKPYGIDDKDNIYFTLQPRNWWDRSQFTNVETSIKNALVEYIIYLWFEYVNAGEADAHFQKYEDYAHSAQRGMNASDGVLMRRFNTPFNTMYGR